MVDLVSKAALLSLLAVGMAVAAPGMALAQDPDDDDKVHNTPPPDPAEEVKKFRAGWDRIANFGMELMGGSMGGGGLVGKNTKVFGSLGITHSGNIRRAGRNPNQAFLGDAGVFSMNALELVIHKEADKDGPNPGMFLRLLDGDIKSQLFARGGSVSEIYGFKDYPLFGTQTRVQFGQFRTPVTFEDFPIGAGVSKPSGYQFLIPKLARGVRTSNQLNTRTSVSLMLLSPLENGVFSRRPPMVALGLDAGTPEKQASRLFLGLQRSEQGWGRLDSLAGLSHQQVLSPRWSVTADILRNRSSDPGGAFGDHRGYSLSTSYADTMNARVLARWDLVEGNGATTPWGPRSFDGLQRAGRVQSMTLAWTLPSISPKTRSIIELRQDWADGGLFGNATNPARNQSTWTFAQFYTF